MIANILKGFGYVGLGISFLWLVEWYAIELADNSLIGMTGYFPFHFIVLISVLSHLSTIAVNRTTTLSNKQASNILDDFS